MSNVSWKVVNCPPTPEGKTIEAVMEEVLVKDAFSSSEQATSFEAPRADGSAGKERWCVEIQISVNVRPSLKW